MDVHLFEGERAINRSRSSTRLSLQRLVVPTWSDENRSPVRRWCSPPVISESLVADAALGEQCNGVVGEDPSPSVATTTMT